MLLLQFKLSADAMLTVGGVIFCCTMVLAVEVQPFPFEHYCYGIGAWIVYIGFCSSDMVVIWSVPGECMLTLPGLSQLYAGHYTIGVPPDRRPGLCSAEPRWCRWFCSHWWYRLRYQMHIIQGHQWYLFLIWAKPIWPHPQDAVCMLVLSEISLNLPGM